MILDKKVKVKINSKNINYFKKLGFESKIKDTIEINIEQLLKGSATKINVQCDICNTKKNISYKDYIKNISSGDYACSSKCASDKKRKNLIKKFGVDNVSKLDEIKKKKKNTCLIKYGNESYNNINKIKKTNIDKYGVDNIAKLNSTKEKVKKTNKIKFGYDYYTMKPDYKQEFNKICLKNFGATNYTKSKIFQQNVIDNIKEKFNLNNIIEYKNNKLIIECEKGHNFEISEYNLYQRTKLYNTEICTICNPLGSCSGKENELLNFIKNNYNYEIVENSREIIKPYELDIYLPKLKIAFEFNGLYWHNELYLEKNYHLNKTCSCENQKIQLIHVWEDDWIYKQDIVKSMILNKLSKIDNKIYARTCEIKEINDNILVKDFLETNNIQGYIESKIKLGLFYKNELVSLMIFGEATGKKSKNEDEYELHSFCNKLNTSTIGGASTLFKYFINNYKPKKIITYVDRSYSQGKLYKTLGFECVRKTEPNYYYVVDGIRKHSSNFSKNILIQEGFDTNKTEHETMIKRKLYRIYDSGNLKYIINLK